MPNEQKLVIVPESFQLVGQVLGCQEKAQGQADWWAGVSDRIAADVALVDEEDRPTVMYVGKSGGPMGVPGANSIFACVIRSAGGLNVSDELEDVNSESIEVTMEQMLNWDPDYIICASQTVYDEIIDDPSWAGLRAVVEGNVLVPPMFSGFDGWFGLLGSSWLNTVLLHPGDEEAHEQLVRDLRDFYQLFYDREMTDEQLTATSRAQYDEVTAALEGAEGEKPAEGADGK